jgi:hypothetical protein
MSEAPTYEDLQKALRLAVNMLAHTEPSDSRAVSDLFVALCSVSCGDASGDVMPIIERTLGGDFLQIPFDRPAPAFYAKWTIPPPTKGSST